MQYGIRPQRPSRRPKRKLIAVVVICLVVVGLVFWRWTSSGNQGQVSATSDQSNPAVIADKVLNGKYITFIYSGEYSAKSLPAKDTDLELYMLSADTAYIKTLAVSVSQLPGGNLDNDSNYLLRKSQPDTYTKSQVEVDGAPAVLWTKHDGFEETVFIPHGNTVATLAFVTSVPSDQLGPEVSAALASFHWK